jgi:hypothetical protein
MSTWVWMVRVGIVSNDSKPLFAQIGSPCIHIDAIRGFRQIGHDLLVRYPCKHGEDRNATTPVCLLPDKHKVILQIHVRPHHCAQAILPFLAPAPGLLLRHAPGRDRGPTDCGSIFCAASGSCAWPSSPCSCAGAVAVRCDTSRLRSCASWSLSLV